MQFSSYQLFTLPAHFTPCPYTWPLLTLATAPSPLLQQVAIATLKFLPGHCSDSPLYTAPWILYTAPRPLLPGHCTLHPGHCSALPGHYSLATRMGNSMIYCGGVKEHTRPGHWSELGSLHSQECLIKHGVLTC